MLDDQWMYCYEKAWTCRINGYTQSLSHCLLALRLCSFNSIVDTWLLLIEVAVGFKSDASLEPPGWSLIFCSHDWIHATCYSEFSVETTEADRQFNSKASCNCRLSWRERSCIVRSNGRYFRVGGIYEQNLWRGTAGGNLWASGDIVGRWGGVLYEQHVGEDWRGSRTAAPALALCALASRRRSGRTNLVSALPPNLPLHCVSFSSLALCFLGSKRCCWRFECRDTFVGLSIQWLPQPFCDSLHVSSALPLKYQDCPHFILSLQHY